MEYQKVISSYLEETKKIADSILIDDIHKITEILFDAWGESKTIYLCGNGGSASTASHFTCDLVKLGLKAQCLNDNPAIITAVTNDDGFDNLYFKQIEHSIKSGDVLVCFSVHGGAGKDKAGLWSQNLVKAITYAKQRKAKVIGFVGFDGGIIKDLADAYIIVGNSTPQTESWHVMIAHLICELMKGRK